MSSLKSVSISHYRSFSSLIHQPFPFRQETFFFFFCSIQLFCGEWGVVNVRWHKGSDISTHGDTHSWVSLFILLQSQFLYKLLILIPGFVKIYGWTVKMSRFIDQEVLWGHWCWFESVCPCVSVRVCVGVKPFLCTVTDLIHSGQYLSSPLGSPWILFSSISSLLWDSVCVCVSKIYIFLYFSLHTDS